MTKKRIIDVPISYVYKLIPPKKRNAVDFNIIERVPVEIPDLSAAEAPAGLRFKPLSSYWSGSEPVDHPWFDGRLYAPFGRAASGAKSLVLKADEMLEMMATPSDGYYVPFDVPRKLFDRDLPYIDIKELPAGRTQDDGSKARAEQIAKVQKQASDTIFVDGRVYLACQEPVYRFGYNSYGFNRPQANEPACHLKTIAPYEIKPHDRPDQYYRVDRLEEALAKMRHVDDRLGHTHDNDLSELVFNPVEVLIPEAVQWRFDVRPRMDQAVESVFEELKRHIPQAELPFMRAYVSFRALREEQPRDYDKIAMAFENEVIPAMEAEKLDPERVRTAVSEWVSREEAPGTVPDGDLAAIAAA